MMDFTETYEDTVSSVGKAARLGDVKILKQLIKSRKSTNIVDNRGWSPLHQAANAGHTKCVRILCKCEDTDVNARAYEGGTALYLAASMGHLDTVKELLEAGADPDISDNERNHPLLKAVRGNHIECVKLLLEYNSDINWVNVDGWRSLHEAAHRGYQEMMTLLLQYNADFDLVDEFKITPLFTAAQYGQLECLRILLVAGANPDIAAIDGGTAVFMAAQENHLQCLQLLCQYGAKIHILTDERYLPIHVAAQLGHYSCLEFLSERTNVMDAEEQCVCSPVTLAAHCRHFDCVKLLVSKGYNINTSDGIVPDARRLFLSEHDFDAVSPLHYAISNLDSEMIRFLMDHGADANFNPNPCAVCTAVFFNVDSAILDSMFVHGAKPSCIPGEEDLEFNSLVHADPYPMMYNGPWFTSVTKSLFDHDFNFPEMMFQKCCVTSNTECFYLWLKSKMNGTDIHDHRDSRDPDYPDLVLHALDYVGHVTICEHFIDDFKDHQMWPTIMSIIGNPRSLQHQCRLKIRHILRHGRSYIGEGFIDQLQLPPFLKDYIRIL